MTTTSNSHAAYRPWSVRTVVVRLSRKLSATYRIRSGRRLSQLLATLLAAVSPWATALPEGAQVVAGQASVSTPSANAMVVNQASDKAVLNWQSFNIGAGQSMQFVQPGAASVALNRVIGNGASSIFGSLSANGQVFLVNPSGVMFAPGAQVNVGGLVASSLDISNGDFMAGRYNFSGSGTGAISNHGSITAARGGYVLLAAPQVTNTGAISAEAGSVGLLAGSRVSVDTSGVGLVRFSVDAAAAQAAIDNSGSITAAGGQVAVLASAMGDAMATVINQSGVIRANSAVERNGTIVLSGGATGIVNVSGELSAAGTVAGQTGGTVKVLGDKVALTGGALIDVSGDAGGGTALVGGDYQGLNAAVQNANRSYIGADASIKADALSSGNGGKVIVWADAVTQFLGSITAKGGAQGGDGGFVETSGKATLQALGSVDASAPNGAAGQWLLDPNNITIQTAGSNTNVSATPNFNSTNDSAIVTTTSIQTALNGGTSVNVTTASAGTNGQAGDITVANAIAKTAGGAATLTLNASNNITFSAGANVTSTTGTLGVTLNAAGTIASPANFSLNGGTLNFNAAGNVTQSGLVQGTTAVVKNGVGTLTLSGANTYSGGTTVKAGTLSGTTSATAFGTGAITLGDSSGSADTTLNSGFAGTHTNAINVAAGNTGVASITSSAASTFSGAVTLNSHDLTLAPAASNLTLTGAVTGAGNLALNTTGAGTITLSGAGTLNNTGTVTNSGTGTGGSTISKVIGSNVTGVVQNSTTSQLTLSGANTYSGGTTIKAGTVSGTVAAAFGTGAITLGDSSGSANTTLNSGFAGTHTNAINVAAGNTGVASITSSAASTFSGAVTLNNHDLRLAPAASNLTLSGGVTGTGNLALNTTGAGTITLSGASAVNNSGTISNTGTGTGAATISAAVGANVTAITENSATSALAVSGAVTVNSGGTTLTNSNASGAALMTVSGGVSGTGNLVVNNNSAIANGVTLSGTAVNNSGTITNSGTGTGTTLVSAAVGANVTGITENSTTSALTVSGALTVNSGGTTLTNSNASGTRLLTVSGGVNGTGNLVVNNNSAIANGITLSTASVNNAGTVTNSGTGTGATSVGVVVGTNVTGVVQNSATSQLTLSGANTYSGGTTIKAGTASGTVAAAFGTGAITLGDSSGSANATLSGGAAHTNAINVAAGNTGVASITSSAASTFSGAVTLNNHDLRLAPAASNLALSGGVTGTGNLALNTTGAGTITLSGASAVNNIGTISNTGTGVGAATISAAVGANVTAITENSTTSALNVTGALTVNGAGTTLTNSNTSGASLLTVSGGVSGTGNLVLNNNSAIANGVTLATGAVNNTGTITNSGTGSGATTISAAVGSNVTAITENSATSALAVTGAVTVNSGGKTLTNSNASGAALLTVSGGVSGPGNLTLNNNSAIANGVTLSGTTANNTGTITNGGTGTGVTLISSIIGTNVTGVVQNSATSQLTLSGANTYSGGTTIKAGTVSGTLAAAFGTGTITLGDSSGGANATLNGGGAVTHANAINVAAGNTGTASITSSANSTFSGAVTLNNHDLMLAPAASTLTLTGAVTGAGNLALNTTGAGTITLSGAGTLNNTGTVTNSGTGTGGSTISKVIGSNVTGVVQNSTTSQLTLSGTNTYSGGTTIKAGTVSGTVAAAFGTGAITLGDSSGNADTTLSGGAAHTNAINVASGNTGVASITSSAASTFSGAVTLNNHDLRLAPAASNLTLSGGITGTGNLALNSTGAGVVTLSTAGVNNTGTISNTGTGAASNVISAAVGSNVTGVVQNSTTSQLTLSGANTYSGGTTVKAGTLSGTTSATAFGTGAITLGDSSGSANTTLNGGFAGTHTNAINVAAGNTGTASITSSANSTFSGAVTLNNHDLRLAPAASNLTLSGGITGTGNLALNSTGIGVVTLSTAGVNNTGTISNTGTGAASNVISAAVGSNVTGVVQNSTTSQLTLSGANTYSGGTTIKAGTVSGTVFNAFGSGVITLGDSSGSANTTLIGGSSHINAINVAAGNTGVASVTSGLIGIFNGGVTLNNHDLRVAPAAGSLTLNGPVTGVGNLTLNTTGAGSITLSGATTVNNSGTISNTGTGAGAATISAAVGANVTAITENSTTSALTISGAVTVNSGGTTLTNSNASGSAVLTVSGGVNGTGNLVLNNNSAIANGITLSGTTANNTGTITNSGTGTGATLISAGVGANLTAIAENSVTSALTVSGVVTVNGGGTTLTNSNTSGASLLTVSGGVSGTGNLALNNNSAIANGITLSTASVNNTGTVSNSGTGTGATAVSAVIGSNVTGVVQNSVTSQLTLSGANTYSGGTTIKAGTVSGTVAAAFGTGAIALGNSSGSADTTLIGGAAHTNAINVAAGNTGVASITSSAASTFSGAVTLNNHALRLAPAASNLTLSGGVTGTGNLALNSTGTGVVTLSTAGVNNTGTISNTGSGTGTTLISAAVGGNVTGVVQNSTTSQLTLSGANTYSGGTTIKAGTVSGTVFNAFGSGVITLGDSSGSADTTLIGGSSHINAINVAAGNTGVASVTSGLIGIFNGGVTLNNHDLRVAPAAGSLTLNGPVTGVGNLTLNTTGAGSITLSGSGVNNVGTVTNSGTGTGGSNIIEVIGTNVTGVVQNSATSQLTLSRANTYTGATAVNAGTLGLGVANAIGAASTVNVLSGAALNLNGFSDTVASVSSAGLVAFGTGNTLTTSGAQTYTGRVTGNNVTLASSGGGAITASNTSNNFSGNLSVSTAGAASVVNAGALALGTVSASSLSARALGGDLTLNGNINASGSGDAIVLTTSGNFTNNAGAGALATPSGRWLVYSTSPVSDVKGGLTAAFKQYNATYGSALLGTGNGFVHSAAPTISAGLTGTVSKVYDGTASATLAAGNFTSSGAIDGDVITLNNPAAGSYDSKNAGTGKTVSVSGVTATASNGATTVYGYQMSGGGTATGNVGTVTARSLTVSATGTNKVYDGNTTAGLTLADNRVAGDVLTASNTAANFVDKNAGAGKTVNVSGIGITGTDAGNYTVNTTAATTADITQRALTVSATGTNKVYDGNTTAGVTLADNRVAGDVLTATNTAASFGDKNVGTGKAVSVSGIGITGTDAGNYTVNTTAATTADITQRALLVSATGTNKVYDGNTTAGVTLADNRVAGDVLTASSTAANFADKNAGTGKAVNISGIAVTGTDAGNYSFNTTAVTTANITQRALTVSATGSNKVYDGNTVAGVTLADNRVAGDVFTASNTAASFADKNVGTGKAVSVSGIGITGTDAGNYSVNTSTATTADITARALTVSATGTNKVYDGNAIAGVTLADNRVAGDVLTASNTAASFGDKNGGTGKAVSVSGIGITGTDAGNYSVNTTAATTADITQRTLTVSATGTNKVYDGNTATSVTLSDNRVAGDVLATNNTAASFVNKNVGTGKTVNVSGIGITGADAGNYSVNTTAATTANITQRALTVSATGSNKVYDGNTTAGVTLADNRVAGDVLTASNTAANFADKNVGTGKAVSVSGIALTGTDAGNYSVNTTAATTADITQRALTVSATGQNRVYDGGTVATVTLSDNRVAGDVLSASSTAASFADKNVGIGKSVSVSGIGITGTDAGNYSVNTTAATTANITQRALTVSATGSNKVYDGNTTAGVTLADNRVAGDTLTASNTAANFADKNVGTGKAVSVSGIGIAGTDAGNYSVNTTAATTANITQRALTVSATGNNKAYDGGTAAGVTLTDNRVAGDVLSASNTAASFADKNVGIGKAVSVAGIAITGTDAGNYSANTTAATTADITQRALTVGAAAQNKVYDGGTTAVVTLSDNRVAGDVLSASNAAASFADKNAGIGKTVNVGGIAITGTDAGNYSVNTTATTTATITPASIANVSGITAADKVQDGTTAATLATGAAAFAGRIGADALTVGAATGNFDTPAVGSGKPVSITGITLSGADAGNYVLLNTTAATTANITPAAANMAERTGDLRIVNGTALPVLEADDRREQAFRRAAGIRRTQELAGTAETPPFRLAGFPDTPNAANPAQGDCTVGAGIVNCLAGVPQTGQGQ